MSSNILCLASSHYSIGKSILLCDNAKKLDHSKPVSIFSLAKEYKLSEVYLADSTFIGFIEAYKASQDCKIPLRFGIKLVVCADSTKKDEESLDTEHKIIVWLKNSNAYKDAIKIYSKACSKDNFYYVPRIDLKTLNSMWTSNLQLMTCPYDNFIHNNIFKNKKCFPEWDNIVPILSFADMELPFDSYLIKNIKNYAQSNKFEIQEVHPIYYSNRNDILAYQVFRTSHERTTINKPNLDHFSSAEFCFESYLEKIKT